MGNGDEACMYYLSLTELSDHASYDYDSLIKTTASMQFHWNYNCCLYPSV